MPCCVLPSANCLFKKYILLILLLQLSHFSHFIPVCLAHPLPPAFPPFSSCPRVVHISSLASTFPILFANSHCLFSTYRLCYLFSVPFPTLSSPNSPTDNPACDLHFCGSVPVLVVCLVCFCFLVFEVQLVIAVSFLSFFS